MSDVPDAAAPYVGKLVEILLGIVGFCLSILYAGMRRDVAANKDKIENVAAFNAAHREAVASEYIKRSEHREDLDKIEERHDAAIRRIEAMFNRIDAKMDARGN